MPTPNLLKTIETYDPLFTKRLNALLQEQLPELPEAERQLLSHFISGKELTEAEFERYLRVVMDAIALVPDYSVEFHELNQEDGTTLEGGDAQILNWSAKEIAEARFKYMWNYSKAETKQ